MLLFGQFLHTVKKTLQSGALKITYNITIILVHLP